MNAKTRNRRLAILILAAAASSLVGAAAYRTTRDVPIAARVAPAPQAPMVGVATGEYDHGLPVYRLPSVQVTASKSEALAAMAREEALAPIARVEAFPAK